MSTLEDIHSGGVTEFSKRSCIWVRGSSPELIMFSYEFKGCLAVVRWALKGKQDFVGELLFGLSDLLSCLL